jgi:hypothetical protein
MDGWKDNRWKRTDRQTDKYREGQIDSWTDNRWEGLIYRYGDRLDNIGRTDRQAGRQVHRLIVAQSTD